MRRPIIAGNWKMNKTVSEGVTLASELKPLVTGATAEVVLCPPYTALYAVGREIDGTRISLGAQNMLWEKSGAYTGFVSPPMLVDCGCSHVILGHSEARGRFGVEEEWMNENLNRVFGDTDESVNRKAKAAFQHGLIPIVCCGELLVEREAGAADSVISRQVQTDLDGLTVDQVKSMVIAYEPVWAIGTGKVCDSSEADRICGVIRGVVGAQFGEEAAVSIRIQYGGSVKPDNASELLGKPNIDGALVGGAALKSADFAAIVAAAG